MDDYAREMMDLKTLVTRVLEKKGILAKIRAELRASVFEAIEEEDRVIEKEEGLPPALLGSCNDSAKQLHASTSDLFHSHLENRTIPSGFRKEEHNRRYGSDELSVGVFQASAALENLQLDRKARNLSTSLRHVEDENIEDDVTSWSYHI